MIVALFVVLAMALPATAATLPAGFAEVQVAAGLDRPTAMAFAPDGRLFITQQAGGVRVVSGGALLPEPFLTLTVDSSGERGLLGIAFDPAFASNNFLYVYYTVPAPSAHNRVSRFVANGNVVVPGSETVLLDVNNLSSATNHNGGAMHFGPDGKLYVAVGENSNGNNAQLQTNLLGKMLRLNADGSIPADNPFYNLYAGTSRAIWALGLRNPFTFAFQPGTGRMLINDVGANTYEEIDEGIAGANYGWPFFEGPTPIPSFTAPIYHYGHGTGSFLGCAITGGTFYNPPVQALPASYNGMYFFADFCGNWINKLDLAQGNAVTTFATGVSHPVDLQVGPDGQLYYLMRGASDLAGAVYRISFPAIAPPAIVQQPAAATIAVGQPANFSVVASGAPQLAYQWQRNHVDIQGATLPTYTIPAVGSGDSGAKFRVVVTNAFPPAATSNDATLTIANTPPVGTITAPGAGAFYKGGETIAYAGTAFDDEEGALAAGRFTWRVDFHRNDPPAQVAAVVPPTSGVLGGSFVVPTTGETSTNVFYRITLTVTDALGLTHTSSRDIAPRTSTITLQTEPPGLQVMLDGVAHAAPYAVSGVVGMRRTIGAATPQTAAGATWAFRVWSSGGAAAHDVTTPAGATTYTATFRKKGRG